jgi:addiction module RelE/StbE family toxin
MTIKFGKNFKKQYKILDGKKQKKFTERLRLFKDDEYNELLNNHKLNSPYKGCRSINISGDLRAIYYKKESKVYFIAIGTHSGLYG